MTARLASTTAPPRLPKNRPRRSRTAAISAVAVESGARRERRDPQEDADEGDALHPDEEVRPRGVGRGEADRVERGDADPAGEDLGADGGRDRRPDRLGVGERRLDEDRPAVDQPGQRVAEGERGDVVERHELDLLELRVEADRRVGDGQVVGRRQALLLRAVARVGLDELVEQLAGERRDELVGRDRSEPADRVAAQRPGAGRPQVGRDALERERVADAEDGVPRRAGRRGPRAGRRRRRGRRRRCRASRARPRTTGRAGP